MKVIETTNAPGAIGPYSQGYEINGFLYILAKVWNSGLRQMPRNSVFHAGSGFFVIDILNNVQYNEIERCSRRGLWIAERSLFRQPLI